MKFFTFCWTGAHWILLSAFDSWLIDQVYTFLCKLQSSKLFSARPANYKWNSIGILCNQSCATYRCSRRAKNLPSQQYFFWRNCAIVSSPFLYFSFLFFWGHGEKMRTWFKVNFQNHAEAHGRLYLGTIRLNLTRRWSECDQILTVKAGIWSTLMDIDI